MFPFSEIDRLALIQALANSGLGLTNNSTPAQIYAALATKFPPTRSWIVSGWGVSSNPAGIKNTFECNNSYVKLTLLQQGDQYGYEFTLTASSPAFDISSFKSLSLVGTSYMSNYGNGYIDLINQSNGGTSRLYTHTNIGKIDTINTSMNVASLSGNYYLRYTIPGRGGTNGSYNIGSYIYLTKALLAA